MLLAALAVQLRGIDEATHTADFVAATERPVAVGPWEPEALRMGGVNLTRYRKNPVLLDSHDRTSLASVVGKVDVSVKDRKLIARCTYAPTERGKMAWELVRGGFVNALSIGYQVDRSSVRHLREGETDGEGDALVRGPATVVNRWTLLEISTVPVPADEDAVRRSFYNSIGRNSEMSIYERANLPGFPDSVPAPPQGGSVSGKPGQGGSESRGTVKCPSCNYEFQPEPDRDADDVSELDQKPDPTAPREAPDVRRRRIMAITPTGFEKIAERCIAKGLSLEQARSVLLREYRKRPTPESRSIQTMDDVSDEMLIRSLEAVGDFVSGDSTQARSSPREMAGISDDQLVRSLENVNEMSGHVPAESQRSASDDLGVSDDVLIRSLESLGGD